MIKPLVFPSIWIFVVFYAGFLTQLTKAAQCSKGMILFDGTCYRQIPGCAYYKSGTQCLKCQDNSNFYNGTCWLSNAGINMFFLQNSNKQKNNNNKGQPNQVKLTAYDILKMEMIKNYISSKYQNISFSNTQPIITDILRTPYQTYFSFLWINTKNETFLFELSINLTEEVSQYIIQKFDPSLQISLFSKINDKLIKKYDKKMIDASLFRIISVSKNLFRIHYYTQYGVRFTAFVQKVPFLQIKSLQTSSQQYNQTQIFNYIISQHDFLVKQSQYTILMKNNTKNKQYQVTFASQSKVVVEQLSSQKYRIIFLYRVQNMTVNQSSSTKLVGGYQTFKDNEDQILRKVLNHLFKQFKFLKLTQITKIEYQIVAGTNFLIHLQDSQNNNQYMCKIFYSLSGEINILQIYLNSVLIHTQPLSPIQLDVAYDYKIDPIFLRMLQYLNKSINMSLSQILYVNKQQKSNQNGNFFKFDIVYQQNSFIVVNYFPGNLTTQRVEIVDLIKNGDNQYEHVDISKKIIEIKQYLQGSKRWLHPLLVQYVKQTKADEYFCKIVTEYGSYFYKLIKKYDQYFQIHYLELIDDQQNCITLSQDEIAEFQQSQKQFLFKLVQNYKILLNTQLSSFSKAVINSQVIYRLLYTNYGTKKKIQVILRQENDTLIVENMLELNNGFQLFEDLSLYQKVVEKASLAFIGTLKSSRAILGIHNNQKSKIYFATKIIKQTVYEVQLDNKLQKSSIKTVFESQKSKICEKIDDKGYCLECKQGQVSLLSNCFAKIKNCMIQLGSQCFFCESQFTLIDNKCTNDCKRII